MRNTWLLSLALCLGLNTTTAIAQDFGRSWMDKVASELQGMSVPFVARPFEYQFFSGLLYSYDDNIYLTARDKVHDSIILPWGEGRIDYKDSHFETSADFLVNYKYYVDRYEASDDEERFFGKAGYSTSRLNVKISEILRHESDPVGLDFINRVDRMVSDTHSSVSVNVTPSIAMDASAGVQIVRFYEEDFQSADNNTYSSALGMSVRLANGVRTSLNGGYLAINYLDPQSVDSEGWSGGMGLHYDASRRLLLDATAGVGQIKSDTIPTLDQSAELTTMQFDVAARYEATSMLVLLADASRQFSFATGTDPFQVNTRVQLTAEYEWTSFQKARGRVQLDHANGARGGGRSFLSLSVSSQRILTTTLLAEAGVTYRAGRAEGDDDFGGWIVNLGVALTY